MKEVTWVLMGRIVDPETHSLVYLSGVRLTGTPLQVATLFECLRELPGKVDVSVNTESDAEIYRIGANTLEEVRSTQKSVDVYEDPDKSDSDEEQLASMRSNWRVHIYPESGE